MKKVFVIIALSTVFIGCSEDKYPSVPGVYDMTNDVKLIRDMAPDDVMVAINGVELRKRDYDALYRLKNRLYRIKNHIPLDEDSKRADGYSRSWQQSYPDEMIRRELMRQAAEKRGIRPDAKKLAKRQAELLDFLKVKKGTTLDDVVRRVGGAEAELLLKRLEWDVTDVMLQDAVATNDLYEVEPTVVSNMMARIDKANAKAEKKNEKGRRLLLEMRGKVLSGGDFVELAKKYCELRPQDAESWESFELGELPDDSPFRAWLSTAKEGDVSELLDFDDGVAIAKVVRKSLGDAPPGMGKPVVYEVVRCLRYFYESYPNGGYKAVRRRILNERRAAVQKELGSELFESAVIVFPHSYRYFETKEN